QGVRDRAGASRTRERAAAAPTAGPQPPPTRDGPRHNQGICDRAGVSRARQRAAAAPITGPQPPHRSERLEAVDRRARRIDSAAAHGARPSAERDRRAQALVAFAAPPQPERVRSNPLLFWKTFGLRNTARIIAPSSLRASCTDPAARQTNSPARAMPASS